MGLILYSPGDTVYYPRLGYKNDKPMTVIDRWVKVYPSKKVFIRYLLDGLLDRLVEEMHANVESDLDNVVCICGSEGSGKSVLAYQLAKKYDPNFDMKRSYVYSFEDLLDRIHDADDDEGSVFWLDEATNIANNRDWMHKDSKRFITMLEMFRSRKWCLLLCIPSYDRMDIYLRESRVRFALEAQWLAWEGRPAKSRGYFSLRRFSVGSGGFHGDMTVGYGCFDDIPKDEKAQYLAIKQGTQDGKIDEFWEDKQKKNRGEQGKTLRKLILKMKEDGSSVTEIAEFTGLSEQTVMNYCTKARKERGDNDRFR